MIVARAAEVLQNSKLVENLVEIKRVAAQVTKNSFNSQFITSIIWVLASLS